MTVDSSVNKYRIDRGTTQMAVFNSVVSTVQEFYREFHRIPDAKQCLERMTVGSTHASVSKIMGSPGFEQSMEARGIPLTDTRGLTPQQSILLSVLTNPADRRTLSGKLKTVGISYATYRNWLRNPLFSNALNREAETTLAAHTGDVLTQLTAKAVSGDLSAIKLHLEVTGRHDPNGTKGPDASVIVAQVLEIIMRRVKDAAVLELIAADLSLLGAGGAVTSPREPVVSGSWVDSGTPETGLDPNLKSPEVKTALQTSPPKPKSPPVGEAGSPEEWLRLNGALFNDEPLSDYEIPEM